MCRRRYFTEENRGFQFPTNLWKVIRFIASALISSSVKKLIVTSHYFVSYFIINCCDRFNPGSIGSPLSLPEIFQHRVRF